MPALAVAASVPPPMHRWLTALPAVLVLLLPVVQLYVYLDGMQVYPFADEWRFVGITCMDGPCPLARWVLEQHGDHRIPLQKGFQLALLHASEFDFRSLVVANMALAAAAAALLLSCARALRGRTSAWDVVIPLIIFNPMAGYAMWGFHLQFLSGVLSVCIFAWAVLRRTIRPLHAGTGVIAVASGAACGVNGLLLASMLLPLCWYALAPYRHRILFQASTVLLVLTLAALWLAWTPASGSRTLPDMAAFMAFLSGLLGSSLLPPTDGHWKAWAVGGMVLLGLIANALASNPAAPTRSGAALTALTGSVLITLAAVAMGRAEYQGGWQPTLAMHYGIIGMLLPLLAWLACARNGRRSATRLAGLTMICLFGTGLFQAAQWRTAYTDAQRVPKSNAYYAIKSDALPIEDVAHLHAGEYWIDDPTLVAEMVRRMPILRAAYQHKWPERPSGRSDESTRDQREAGASLRR